MFDATNISTRFREKEGYLPLISQLNEKLNELESRNKLIQEHFYKTFHESGIGMAILELDGSFREVNQCLADVFGYKRAEMEGGMCFHDLMDVEGLRKDSDELIDLVNGTISSYQTYKKFYSKDGKKIPVILNVSLIRNNHGQPLYLVSQIIPVNAIANLAACFEERGR